MMMTTPKPLIVCDEELEYDQCVDISNHGMSGGVSGFIYSSELFDKYQSFEDEIVEYLDEYCDDNFSQGALDYIVEQLSFDDKYWTMQELKEYAVWMYVELKVYDYLNELEVQ